MKHCIYYVAGSLLLILSFNCKEPYALPAKAVQNSNFLVVEGNISVGFDSTVIRMSRSKPLNDSTVSQPELGAHVIVETDAGGSFPLQELGDGGYGIAAIPSGGGSEKYRLNITTSAGSQYLSDYVESKQTPPIDSVNWVQLADGVHIYVNAHDDKNLSKYYKWDNIETWQYHAPFASQYTYSNGAYIPRNPSQLIYTCWRTITSSNISIESTAKLSSDIVYRKELMFIPASNEKIGVEYSILVKQTCLTAQGFNYWDVLNKNTESLGSLFDALPSQQASNIHSASNAAEVVVGFISAATTQQQRIFISKQQLTNWAYPPGPYSVCDTIHLDNPQATLLLNNGSYIPIDKLTIVGPYYGTTVECVDCRLKGGVTAKPSFWP